MKITVHSLSSDTNDGTQCEVFATEKELLDRLKELMPAKGSEGSDETLDELLEEGDIYEAWFHWLEVLKENDLDTYGIDTHTLEIPASVKIEVTGGVAQVTRCTPGVAIEIIDHDNAA